MNQNPFAPPQSSTAADSRHRVRWGISLVAAALALAAFNIPVLGMALSVPSTRLTFLVEPGYWATISFLSLVVALTLDRFVRSKLLLAFLSMITLVAIFCAMAAYAIITR